jgi:hypothetical protein
MRRGLIGIMFIALVVALMSLGGVFVIQPTPAIAACTNGGCA